jgi:hypothetical protein
VGRINRALESHSYCDRHDAAGGNAEVSHLDEIGVRCRAHFETCATLKPEVVRSHPSERPVAAAEVIRRDSRDDVWRPPRRGVVQSRNQAQTSRYCGRGANGGESAVDLTRIAAIGLPIDVMKQNIGADCEPRRREREERIGANGRAR